MVAYSGVWVGGHAKFWSDLFFILRVKKATTLWN